MTAQRLFEFCAICSKTLGRRGARRGAGIRHAEIHITDLGEHPSNVEAAKEAAKLGLRPDALICTRAEAFIIADTVAGVWRIPRAHHSGGHRKDR